MITRPSPLNVVLTVIGAGLVTWQLFQGHTHTPWGIALVLVAVLAWLARTVLAVVAMRHPVAGRLGQGAAMVAVIAGSVAAPLTNGLSIVPAAICAFALMADRTLPVWVAAAVATAGIGLLASAAVVRGTELLPLIAMCAGMLVAILGGYNRRQSLAAAQQAATLAERELQMREEASRIALARDLHDVLAHTLGGLVIQLDAAEALMDAGEAAAARTRVTDARALAGAGLGEARRAVSALRAPQRDETPDSTPERLRAALDDLLDAHRALGGAVDFAEHGTPAGITGAAATALQRALQEALSNARRHAAGEPVAVVLDWAADHVTLTVANPMAAGAPPSPGGGYGLVGMRERFAALPGGGTVRMAAADGMFTLTAEARTA